MFIPRRNEIIIMEYLIQAQKEYIEFLGREISNASMVLIMHGWECPQEVIEEGNRLRLKISEFSAKTK